MTRREHKAATAQQSCATCGQKIESSTSKDTPQLEYENYWQIEAQEGWEVEVTCKNTGGCIIPRTSWPYPNLNLVAARRPICKSKSTPKPMPKPRATRKIMPPPALEMDELLPDSENVFRFIVDEQLQRKGSRPNSAHPLYCSSCNTPLREKTPETEEPSALPHTRRSPLTHKTIRKTPKKKIVKRSCGKPRPRPAFKRQPVARKPRKVIEKAAYEPRISVRHGPFSQSKMLICDSPRAASYKSLVIREMRNLGRTPNPQYEGGATPGYRLVCSRLLLKEREEAERAAKDQKQKQEEEAAKQKREAEAEALQKQEEDAFKDKLQIYNQQMEEQPQQQQQQHEEHHEVQHEAQHEEQQNEHQEDVNMDSQPYSEPEGEANVFATCSDKAILSKF
ncbi:serine/threonine-protein kinase Warts-like isoform X1 [Drosophila subobscura]|uniref:serine/threonine-protein kinase Warts-like isoform X1 n=1 Tax=Drosophila subobscura TaxID=7241 RepID=UPI00155AD267|nr:serine/threonine-protein kinase Warts-like isoform X1 [Drosophila subobscura]